MSRTARLALLGCCVLLLLAFFAVVFRSFLLPFLVGLAAAYLLDPVADRLQVAGLSRGLSTLAITVGFFGLVLLAFAVLVPLVVVQAGDLIEQLPSFLTALRERFGPLLDRLTAFGPLRDLVQTENIENIAPQFGERILSVAGQALGSLFQSGLAAVNLLSLLFVTPVVTFYLLRDWDVMIARLRGLFPPDVRPAVDDLAGQCDEVLAGFFRGQALVCLFLAVFYGIGLWLVGLQYGLVIGLLTGLFTFVPYVGMLVGAAVGLLVAAFQFQNVLMIGLVAGVFALGQFFEGNFVTPRLVGSRIHLHPVWVIFAVFAGAVLAGLVGALFAVPVAGVIAVFIRYAVARWRTSRLYDGTSA